MVENRERSGYENTRIVEKMGELFLVGLIGKHKGDIAETPGFKKEKLTIASHPTSDIGSHLYLTPTNNFVILQEERR